MRITVFVRSTVCIFCTSVASGQSMPWPWAARVESFVPAAAGEHPRLLFRKGGIPALRRRAATDRGRAMIAHLKVLLGGGEVMPTRYCNDPPVNYLREDWVKKQPVGTYTVTHGAGFGFLYVLTGKKKYADLSRRCVEKVFAGQVDRDSRYNWKTPGTGFRCSLVLQGICMAYDFCYDAWDEDFRKQVVTRVQAMNQPKFAQPGKKPKYYCTLEHLAKGGKYPPGSNHFGAYLLGPGLAALTFRGDPGADDKQIDVLLATVEANLSRLLGGGFGDHGWFAEGTSCGRISANNGVLPLLQSLKIAGGKDYISPRPHGRYTVLHLMYTIVPTGKSMNESRGKYYPVPSRARIPHRGDYGNDNLYERPIISHMGDFAQGMGAVLPREARAMAWIHKNFVELSDQEKWNAPFYPHLAVYAFVNWPDETTDPDEVLPRTMVDETHGYYVTRNRWQNRDDIVVTTLLKRGPHCYKSGRVRRGTFVWGLGDRVVFGGLEGKTSHYRSAPDGSMELADESGNALAVDFSSTSGAMAVVAVLGKVKPARVGKARITELVVRGKPVTVMTLAADAHPRPSVDGGMINVGGQRITVGEGKLTLVRLSSVEASRRGIRK